MFLDITLEKEMATHSSILAWRIQGWGSLVGCRLWGGTESDMTKETQQQQQQSGDRTIESRENSLQRIVKLKKLLTRQLKWQKRELHGTTKWQHLVQDLGHKKD